MILWRIDDITFAGEMEGRLLIQEVFEELVQLFETHGGRLTLGVITRYGGKGVTDHPRMGDFLRLCHAKGHTVAGHGRFHRRGRSFREMSPRQLHRELTGQQQDFTDLGVPMNWICYPFNHGSPIAETWMMENGVRSIQGYFSRWSHLRTVTSWRNPHLSQEKLGLIVEQAHNDNYVVVEDHLWFYQGKREIDLLCQSLRALSGVPIVSANAIASRT